MSENNGNGAATYPGPSGPIAAREAHIRELRREITLLVEERDRLRALTSAQMQVMRSYAEGWESEYRRRVAAELRLDEALAAQRDGPDGPGGAVGW